MPKENYIVFLLLCTASTQLHPTTKLSIADHIKFINNSFAYGPLAYDSYKRLKEYIPYLCDKKYQNKKVEFLKKNNLATDTLSYAIKNEVRAVLKECNISQSDTIPILECKDLDCPAVIGEGPIILVDVDEFTANITRTSSSMHWS